MRRREFLVASAAVGLGLVSAKSSRAADSSAARDLVELRVYSFASPEKQAAYEAFLAKTAVPAFNRAGIKPVGVFKLTKEDNQKAKEAETPCLYVVLPHSSLESVLTLDQRLAADDVYQKAAADLLDAPRKDPAYTNVETTLISSWEASPKVAAPSKAETRIVQMRLYQAHNESKARRKSEMFNQGKEMAIFESCGMPPVFGGRALAGPKMPNVTYALSHDNPEAMKAGWSKFGQHPDWKKLRGDDTYKDTDPILIVNLVLRPVAGSQI
jgi:hypothetical protein